MFCFVFAICDLAHDVGAILGRGCYTWPMLAANSIWKSILKYES